MERNLGFSLFVHHPRLRATRSGVRLASSPREGNLGFPLFAIKGFISSEGNRSRWGGRTSNPVGAAGGPAWVRLPLSSAIFNGRRDTLAARLLEKPRRE